MSSQLDPRLGSASRVKAPTTLRWIGIGAPSTIEGIQSVTVDPDATTASAGAPEWLVTNGLGGYASGTMTGLVTRRFHGFLVAALPAPRGRTMMLNHLRAIMCSDKGRALLLVKPDAEGTSGRLAKQRGVRSALGLPMRPT